MTIITPTQTGDIANFAVTQIKLSNDINISKFVNDVGYTTVADIPQNLFDLNDMVAIQAAADGQVIGYSSAAGGWVNVTASTDIVPEGTSNLYFTETRAYDAINNSFNDFVQHGKWDFNQRITVDGRGQNDGFLAIGDTFANVARVQKDFPIGIDPFETGFINQANYADTIPNMISAPGYFGHTLQFRFTSGSHPLIVDGQSKPDTFLGGFNSFVVASDYTDDDNFSATFSISHLDRVNQSESFPVSARFNKYGLTAPLGITSNGNNTIGDGSGDITLNGPLFILGGNQSAPTATSDPGTPGELRVTSPNGTNFYMYLYANGVGWLRTEFTTF